MFLFVQAFIKKGRATKAVIASVLNAITFNN